MLKPKLKAAAWHLLFSLFISLFLAHIVFFHWYPYPYYLLSGGKAIFMVLFVVDVVVGPICTAVIFNPVKRRRELVLDLGVVLVVQMLALSYGIWSLYQARPVALVFEYRLFRVVHANEVFSQRADQALLTAGRQNLDAPLLLSVRPFVNPEEKVGITMQALAGINIASRKDMWQSYDLATSQVHEVGRSVSQLKLSSDDKKKLQEIILRSGADSSSLLFLPAVSRTKQFWTVIVKRGSGAVVGFLPVSVPD